MSHQNQTDRLERRLAYYTVAASAGMLASAASAAPTNADIDVEVTAQQGDSQFESFEVGPVFPQTFSVSVNNNNGDGYGGYCGSVWLSADFPSGWTAYAQPIAAGSQVDDSFQFGSGGYLYQDCEGQDPGVFELNERGFIGFRIPAEDDVPNRGFIDSWHYGYMDVEISGDLTAAINAVWFESTPDTPITIPAPFQDVRSVPVGGALPLGLLLFAAGAAALRRRNRAEA